MFYVNKKIAGVVVILLSAALWRTSQPLITSTPSESSLPEITPEISATTTQKASLTASSTKDDIISYIEEYSPEIGKFARCESTYRPTVCSYAGCHSGMGLCGFIPSTWNETLARMKKAEIDIPQKCDVQIESVAGFQTDKTHPVFDPECNLLLAKWLYNEDGDGHWNSSKDCWEHL